MKGREAVVGAGWDRGWESRQLRPGPEDAQGGWSREGRALRMRVENKEGLGMFRVSVAMTSVDPELACAGRPHTSLKGHFILQHSRGSTTLILNRQV